MIVCSLSLHFGDNLPIKTILFECLVLPGRPWVDRWEKRRNPATLDATIGPKCLNLTD